MRARWVRPMGAEGWLVACDPEETAAWARELRERPVPGQTSVRVGAASVLVAVRPTSAREAFDALSARTVQRSVEVDGLGAVHLVDVRYDGDDCDALARELGMSTDALVERHGEQEWTVAFCGFSPGFAYLRGWELEVPRLASPRPAVPAGAVAVAGPFSAVYPTASPGGWRLLGRTDAPVWDVDRDPPALLAPGDRVRYRAVHTLITLGGRSAEQSGGPHSRAQAPVPLSTAEAPVGAPAPVVADALTILDPGILTLVEDAGRPGWEHLGVSPSGALDSGAARRANRLVGNERSAALLETLGGLVLRAERDIVVALTGARTHVAVLDPAGTPTEEMPGASLPAGTPFAVRAGHLLSVAPPSAGLRVYLALRGGIDAPRVLGSRSSDVLGGLGPGPLRHGTVLRLGRALESVALPEPQANGPERPSVTVVSVVLGPHDDEFGPDGLAALTDQEWRVSTTSNRVGIRLEGAGLTRLVAGEVPSAPMVAGAVQVPPSGRPVVLLRDHPVTGGYPVIGVVLRTDLDLLAQVQPGGRLVLRRHAGTPGGISRDGLGGPVA